MGKRAGRELRWYVRAATKLRAEQERRWDGNHRLYGIAEPQYHRPEDFPSGAWERWCADRPRAINVVARRREGAEDVEVSVPPPVPTVGPTQLSLF
jgi:hypothetical protein